MDTNTRHHTDDPRGGSGVEVQPDGGGAALDNHADGSSSTRRTRYQSNRRERFALRETLWEITSIDRCGACGRYRIDEDEQYQLVLKRSEDGEKTATVNNVQTCGSVWACPVCAARKRQERAEEIRAAVDLHLEDGGGVYYWTGTMRHDQGHTLEEGIEAMKQAWGNRVISGSSWVRDREDFGIVGYVKSPDFTYGHNGWHPHLPVIFFTEEPLSESEREELKDRIYDRWSAGVEDGPLGKPLKINCPLEAVRSVEDLSDYVGQGPVKSRKQSGDGEVYVPGPEEGREKIKEETVKESMDKDVVGLELHRHDAKSGNDEPGTDQYHFTPFELLWEIHEWPDSSDEKIRLWREYEQATFNLRSIYWSRSLSELRERARSLLEEEEEEVEEEVIREIEPILYRVIVRESELTALLEAAEGIREESLIDFFGRMRARVMEIGPPV